MKIAIIIILVLIAVIVILSGIVSVTVKGNKTLKAENKQLLAKIGQLNINIDYLVNHARELAQIKKDKAILLNRIKEAQTDEEIAAIISDVVTSNNQRMQNVSEK